MAPAAPKAGAARGHERHTRTFRRPVLLEARIGVRLAFKSTDIFHAGRIVICTTPFFRAV